MSINDAMLVTCCVLVKLEVTLTQPWNPSSDIGSITKQATAEALGIVGEKIRAEKIKIIGEPKVSIVVVTNAGWVP